MTPHQPVDLLQIEKRAREMRAEAAATFMRSLSTRLVALFRTRSTAARPSASGSGHHAA